MIGTLPWMEKKANIVGSENPNSKCTAEGSNAGVCAFGTLHKRAMGGEDFFLLATSPGLEVSDVARKEIGTRKYALASSAEIRFFYQLLLLESKPASDLFPAKGDLTATVANIKDRKSTLRLVLVGRKGVGADRGSGSGKVGYVRSTRCII
jgi:hypothetical protein